jgi:hypothetical protein
VSDTRTSELEPVASVMRNSPVPTPLPLLRLVSSVERLMY